MIAKCSNRGFEPKIGSRSCFQYRLVKGVRLSMLINIVITCFAIEQKIYIQTKQYLNIYQCALSSL